MIFCVIIYLDNRSNPVEFQGHRSKVNVTWVFGCVHDAVATRGKYLALSKAWWSWYSWVVLYAGWTKSLPGTYITVRLCHHVVCIFFCNIITNSWHFWIMQTEDGMAKHLCYRWHFVKIVNFLHYAFFSDFFPVFLMLVYSLLINNIPICLCIVFCNEMNNI